MTREPWALAKDPAKRKELDTALYVAAEPSGSIAELVRPFVPETGERTLRMLGICAVRSGWLVDAQRAEAGDTDGPTSALFPRMEQSLEEPRTWPR